MSASTKSRPPTRTRPRGSTRLLLVLFFMLGNLIVLTLTLLIAWTTDVLSYRTTLLGTVIPALLLYTTLFLLTRPDEPDYRTATRTARRPHRP